MKPIYLIPFLAFALNTQAQTQNKAESPSSSTEQGTENTVYNMAGLQVQPEFPGGLKAFYDFILSNFKDPIVEDGPKTLKAYISFIVEKDGSVTNIKLLRDPGYGVGNEAIRVLKLSPNWKPGEQNDKPVRASFNLPITINIPAPEKVTPETVKKKQ